jgi:hypothetical protein
VAWRGVARRGEARRGEARRGEARRGEARRGEARRGEARRGDAIRTCNVFMSSIAKATAFTMRCHPPPPNGSYRSTPVKIQVLYQFFVIRPLVSVETHII